MNPEPKAVIQARLNAIHMTPVQLATQLGMTPALLDNALAEPMLESEEHLLAILNALGLEVVIQPEQD